MLSRYMYSISGAVLAAVAGAYIWWGPISKRPKDKCRGLVNVGNSCFLNSLLQAWAACPSLYSWLRHSLVCDNSNGSSSLLGCAVFKVLRVLNNEVSDAPDPYNPCEIFQALRSKRWVITSEEQDMHELFHVMTETLEEETSCYPSVLSLFDVQHLQGSLSLDSLLNQFITPEVVQKVECGECAKITKTMSARSNFRKKVSIGKLPQVLCIHLPRTQWLDNGATVKRFDHVSFPETLHMDQYLYCKQSRSFGDNKGLQGGVDITLQMLSQTAKPVTAVTSAPVNLLRTLNFDHQFTQAGLFLHPHTAPQIPNDLSDVNHNAPLEVIKTSTPEFSYRLAAVVCHLGDVQLGHFVAYRRGVHTGGESVRGAKDFGSKWWFTNDSSVQRVSLQQVLSAEAYMLFYERL